MLSTTPCIRRTFARTRGHLTADKTWFRIRGLDQSPWSRLWTRDQVGDQMASRLDVAANGLEWTLQEGLGRALEKACRQDETRAALADAADPNSGEGLDARQPGQHHDAHWHVDGFGQPGEEVEINQARNEDATCARLCVSTGSVQKLARTFRIRDLCSEVDVASCVDEQWKRATLRGGRTRFIGPANPANPAGP